MNDLQKNADELELIESCKQGNRSAFNRLVLRYQDLVFGLCLRLEPNRQDAEDAAQEVFVKAYKSISRFRADSKFSTWLYRIAINTCRNRHRSFWRTLMRHALPSDEPEYAPEAEMSAKYGANSLPDKELEIKTMRVDIFRSLRSLSHKHREIIVLRDIHGLSYEEIETATGMNMGTVKSSLARARAALRNHLTLYEHGADSRTHSIPATASTLTEGAR